MLPSECRRCWVTRLAENVSKRPVWFYVHRRGRLEKKKKKIGQSIQSINRMERVRLVSSKERRFVCGSVWMCHFVEADQLRQITGLYAAHSGICLHCSVAQNGLLAQRHAQMRSDFVIKRHLKCGYDRTADPAPFLPSWHKGKLYICIYKIRMTNFKKELL